MVESPEDRSNVETGASPAVQFRNVSYRLGNGRELLHQLNLEVRRGETLVLLGRSGCGKTTTLKLINHLLTTSGGDLLVEGRSIHEWDVIKLRRGIGYVIQDVGLFPHFTIEKNIGLVPKIEGWTTARIHQRVEELMRLVGLDSQIAARYPHQLSGGQRQRVGFARALAADPPILLMDEPFGALDPLTRFEVQQEFLALQSHLKKSVVLVTHDLREALLLADRIALMDAGCLATVLTPEEFMNSQQPLVAAYVAAFAENPKRNKDHP
jgi:osmoprotectant transport system ATP-binding protein